ncbi:phosphatase PAP2 family protein [Microbacterium sp. LWH13-1.2]|uniref:phosphatase PAP2 family protein n=1 Tax=Microbacterium sp. LWH13-1.2 TaxID=3135260 RepID=UPI00313899D1
MIDVARSTSALIAGVSATVAFVVLRTVVAMGGHEPLAIDAWWHDLMASLTNDVWVVVAWVPAVVGGTLGMIVIGAALIAWLVWRTRRWDAATLAIAMVAVVAIGATMAAVIGRTRPEDSLAESVATSFPSGHTAVATTVVVILALTFHRWYVWALGAVWVVTMMWSRTYLHAHWLSDVVAGLLEGIAVACFVWVCVDAARARHARRTAAASAGESAGEETIESSVTP